MLALLFTGLLLAKSPPAVPSPSQPVVSTQAQAGADYILIRQAYYGPTWGHYQNLQLSVSQACGPQSLYCETYCPKRGFGIAGKSCQTVYACGSHMTKSTRSLSGELIVLDCRPASAQNF